MDSISKIIKNGLKKNSEELKKDLLESNTVKEYIKNGLNFNIYIGYDKNLDVIYLEYTFKKEEKQISVRFQMSELKFNFNSIEISLELIHFAMSYFNGTEYKKNIRQFINEFYDYYDKEDNIKIEDDEEYRAYKRNQKFREQSNLSIQDDVTEKEIR